MLLPFPTEPQVDILMWSSSASHFQSMFCPIFEPILNTEWHQTHFYPSNLPCWFLLHPWITSRRLFPRSNQITWPILPISIWNWWFCLYYQSHGWRSSSPAICFMLTLFSRTWGFLCLQNSANETCCLRVDYLAFRNFQL